jgi:hypothetical protein
MGLLIALKNVLNNRVETLVERPETDKVVQRARVTAES